MKTSVNKARQTLRTAMLRKQQNPNRNKPGIANVSMESLPATQLFLSVNRLLGSFNSLIS